MAARFPIIVGPTAGGKSALAMAIAAQVAGPEVISADAFAVYQGMDIGTAKPDLAERGGIPHHMIDILGPSSQEAFTVHDWLAGADRIIASVRQQGGMPIVVGGTHLYVKALLDGLFEGPEPDEVLRHELRSMGLAALRAELERVDPQAALRIHANDERRTVRALEVFRQTGMPISSLQRQWEDAPPREDRVLIGLVWEIEGINRRINSRVKAMMERGLLEEVTRLYEQKQLGPQAREALGYKQIIDYLEKRLTLDEAVERIKIETRRFAKNQRTWLKRLKLVPGSVWIDCDRVESQERVEIAMKAIRG